MTSREPSPAASSSSYSSDEDLDALLEAAKASARRKGKAREIDALAEQDSVILLDDETGAVADVQVERYATVPLPKPSTSRTTVVQDNFGQLPRKKLSKRAYAASQPKTAGSKWFDMPAAPTEPSPELKREVAALKLSGVIDRKRFLKGEAKRGAGKMPEYFQMGHIMPEKRAATTDTRGAGQAGRKRSFVEALVADTDGKDYAKKRYLDLQTKAASGGKNFYRGLQRDRYGSSAQTGRKRR